MKLNDFSKMLKMLHTEYGIDSMDALILNELLQTQEQGDVPTMTFIKKFSTVSQATTHKRVKRLIKAGWITRTNDETNLRLRKLAATQKTLDMAQNLSAA